jgi:alkanesulfonate monooxygenase SsuD/methylene tetrahydromethanopterin reductase-like flavin-dependent oxidoreductase (luciferase family)
LDRPYVIAGVNVIVADTSSDAHEQFHAAKLSRVTAFFGRGRSFTDAEAEAVLGSPAGQHIEQMTKYSAVGTTEEVKEYIEAFAKHADADELIVAHHSPTAEARLRSVELLADSVIDS